MGDATLLCARRVPGVETDTIVEQSDGAADRARLHRTNVFRRGDEERRLCLCRV